MNKGAIAPVAHFISCLEKDGGLKGTDIANFTKTSKATVSRWKNGQVTPHAKTQLILSDLNFIVSLLKTYYSTPDEIRTWLNARHPQLDGRRAIELIHQDKSEEVVNILNRLDAGAYL